MSRPNVSVRYDRVKHQATLRVTIYAEAISALSKKIHAIGSPDSPNKIHNDETAPVADTSATGARSHVVCAPNLSAPGACEVAPRRLSRCETTLIGSRRGCTPATANPCRWRDGFHADRVGL